MVQRLGAGHGELDTVTVSHGSGSSLRCVERQRYPNSLGKLFGAVSRYLGFWGPTKEGKVMAMAAYGEPVYSSALSETLNWGDKCMPRVDTGFFDFGITPLHPSSVSAGFTRLFGEPRGKDDQLEKRHFDMAASAQALIERAVAEMASRARRATGEKNLCYAGGMALNCRANAGLLDGSSVQHTFIPPAPHDAGLALGAAYLGSLCMSPGQERPDPLPSAFLGPMYLPDDVLDAAASLGLTPRKLDAPEVAVARILSEGGLVGWFQGRLEYGPRALGNRSLLADPRREHVREELNSAVKGREWFRPFGPAVLAEEAAQIFDCIGEYPFMQFTCRVRESWRTMIPAVVHSDGTSRIQTVSRHSNPKFYDLIRAFRDLTGVPLVLNTSLNGPREPLVSSPFDALSLFADAPLTALVVGEYLFRKSSPVLTASMRGAGGRSDSLAASDAHSANALGATVAPDSGLGLNLGPDSPLRSTDRFPM